MQATNTSHSHIVLHLLRLKIYNREGYLYTHNTCSPAHVQHIYNDIRLHNTKLHNTINTKMVNIPHQWIQCISLHINLIQVNSTYVNSTHNTSEHSIYLSLGTRPFHTEGQVLRLHISLHTSSSAVNTGIGYTTIMYHRNKDEVENILQV